MMRIKHFSVLYLLKIPKDFTSPTFVPGTLTLLALKQDNFPIVLTDRKTSILHDGMQPIHSLSYSNFYIYFIYLQGK